MLSYRADKKLNLILLKTEKRRLLLDKERMDEEKFIWRAVMLLIFIVIILPVFAYYSESNDASIFPALFGVFISLWLTPLIMMAKGEGEDRLNERLKTVETKLKALEEE